MMHFRRALDEIFRQRNDLARAIAQRRHPDLDHVEAIIKVLAKTLLAHELFEVLIGRRDDARIDLDGLGAADALEGFLLQEAQQLDLQRERQVADLIEEDACRPRPPPAAPACP